MIGAIYLDHRETEGVFSPRDVRILEALSHLTGIAFENARYRRLLESENEMLREEIDRREHVHDIVTESPVMKGDPRPASPGGAGGACRSFSSGRRAWERA